MDGAEAPSAMPSWMELWNEWEIQVVVIVSFSLQVILFFFAGIRRYSVSFVTKALLWLVYLLADVVATYALGHMSSSLSKKSSSEHQLVAFWAPFLLLHLGGQDTITAYALEDNELWLRHLLNMFVQVACTAYVLYKYIIAGGANFVHAAMLVLASGILKYGERIWALKLASKGGSHYKRRRRVKKPFYRRWIRAIRREFPTKKDAAVLTAHALRHVFVKPLIIDRNEASINWNNHRIALLEKGHAQEYQWENDQSKDASAKEKSHIGKMFKEIEVQLALMYDMLYTKAEVIHTRYGYCIRAISLVSCFAALVVFRKSKRDVYSTPDIVITFALLGGACALEMASVFKAIGSTWTCASLRRRRWKWLPNEILFARHHLLVLKDGRWSDSVGQFDFISFCVHSRKMDLKVRIARLIGLRDLWHKVRCTKHAKLSPAVKEFVWGLLRGDKSHMVRIEEVDIRSGNWARRFSGVAQIKQLDWSLSYGFHKSVLIWHIATSTFLNNPAAKLELVDKDMAEAVNTLSDYMMYLLIEHPDILPMKPAAKDMFQETCLCYGSDMYGPVYVMKPGGDRANVVDFHKQILNYNSGCLEWIRRLDADLMEDGWDDYPGQHVLVKACTLAHTMLDMDLGLEHKMAIIGTVWTEMLCYAATNATGGFHARQLSNGGEFLTHILLLTKYSFLIDKEPKPSKTTVEAVEASAAGHIVLNVDNDSNDEITEIRPT
ncbi:hypothetical protein VPH35_126321 [Triticum aestivum]|uniref:uncharacterized protein isoform X2 n=1 Tax=Triticum aestivum TaxID=4565 RepID=UPI000842EC7B|nr:uncharacterized protein LOC123146963 isoform X2 [Triticum aestivum]